jgi:hypothetical protein
MFAPPPPTVSPVATARGSTAHHVFACWSGFTGCTGCTTGMVHTQTGYDVLRETFHMHMLLELVFATRALCCPALELLMLERS